MSETFLSFERDFCHYLNAIRKKTASLDSQSQAAKERTIGETLQEIVDAEKCVSTRQLRQMEIETFMMHPNTRLQLSSQVRKYREDIDREKRLCKKEEREHIETKQKETLMGSRLYSQDAPNQGLMTAQLISSQNDRLEHGRQAAHEAEGIAIVSMHELARQRETVKHTTQSVLCRQAREIGADLAGSSKLLGEMESRSHHHKAILLGVLVMLLAGLVVVLYFKFS
jgi:FtsZ-binding cell division protein ZapB